MRNNLICKLFFIIYLHCKISKNITRYSSYYSAEILYNMSTFKVNDINLSCEYQNICFSNVIGGNGKIRQNAIAVSYNCFLYQYIVQTRSDREMMPSSSCCFEMANIINELWEKIKLSITLG